MDDDRVRREGRFSSTEAAFTGFRLLAREPVTAAVWAGLVMAFTLVMGVASVLILGAEASNLGRLGETNDVAESLRLVVRLAPVYLLLLALTLAVYAVFYGAVNRAVLRPQDRGFAYLRLGQHEARQLGVLFVYGLVITAVYVVLLIPAILILHAVRAANGAEAGDESVAGGLMFVAMLVAVVAAVIFLAVRLSLCTPLTFDRARISLAGSWRLTERRFWALFGAYLLAGLVCVLLILVLMVVTAAIAAIAGGGLSAAGVIIRPDTSSLRAYFAPVQLIWTLVSGAASAVSLVVTIGVSAGAYAQIRALEAPAAPVAPERGF